MAAHTTHQTNVLVVNFDQDANAYEALSDLKELDDQGQVDLRAAAVIVRNDDGRVVIKDDASGDTLAGTATGGIIGLLIGILGGPLGILIGGATGLLIGSLFDTDDEDDTESVLSEMSRAVRVEHTALMAEVDEQSSEVVDSAMARLSGTVLRRPLADVEREIAAAEEAQKAAKRQARKKLAKARRDEHKAEIHAKIEELKAKLRPHKHAAPAGA
jgi:uncharacterized membrane protein